MIRRRNSTENSTYNTIWWLNDVDHLSFKEIQAVIRKEIKDLDEEIIPSGTNQSSNCAT
jgi:hypothetical protein